MSRKTATTVAQQGVQMPLTREIRFDLKDVQHQMNDGVLTVQVPAANVSPQVVDSLHHMAGDIGVPEDMAEAFVINTIAQANKLIVVDLMMSRSVR